MVTFPNLNNFYNDWRKDLEAKGVDIRLNTDVTQILQRSNEGVILQTRPFDSLANERRGEQIGPPSEPERFDELILCVLADDSLKILGRSATFKERFVLGGAKFFDDITITHSDSQYFRKHYETNFDPELCAQPHSKKQRDQIAFAKAHKRGPDDEPSGFRPMYFTKSYVQDPTKIEMSFDCTNYQHQFRIDHDAEMAPVLFQHHVFQSIFLDKRNKHLWTMDEIDESQIIERKWWHQVGRPPEQKFPCHHFRDTRSSAISFKLQTY